MDRTRSRTRPSSARDTARRVLELESTAVAELAEHLDEGFDRAVELVNGCVGRIVVTGMGKSGIICQKLAATFSSTGRPAFFMHPAEALHGDLGMIVAGDVLLAASNSGETQEVVRLLELVRRLGASIVAMTGNDASTLARFADAHIFAGVRSEACPLDLVPTASTCAALAMGDALAVACYEARGFTAEEFARVHPGGRLGRGLTVVESLMHRGHDLPSVRIDATMRETIAEISRGRLGMVCVVADDHTLAGVVTDGDLRRRMLAVAEPLSGTPLDVMTSDPVTLGPDALASEALRMMEARKITSVPIVDGEQRVLGVIQIHDLWRTELF